MPLVILQHLLNVPVQLENKRGFQKNKIKYGGEVVSLTRRPAALYPQEDSWY
jgi:hypothetical protein